MSLSDCITFQNSGYFSTTMIDYLNQSENIKPFYHLFPSVENFKFQIEEKKSFNPANRAVLTKALTEQYHNIKMSEATKNHITQLNNHTTFTITTGHQLNL